MSGKVDQPPVAEPVDLRLARLARRQYGVVSREQLVLLGIGPAGIEARVRSGRLQRIYRGVYAVGHSALRLEGHWLAAVLACGSGAVLSHQSAAALWEIRPSGANTVDVTVRTRGGRARRAGLRVHRSSRLASAELTVRDGIPVTTVARTLLDLADVLPGQALKRAIDEAEYRNLFDLTSVTAAVENNPGRRGSTLLRLSHAPPERTRSELERAFLEVIGRNGLPRPRVAMRIAGHEADFAWPEQRLIVETDGLASHRTVRALEADRHRDRDTLRAGYRTIRLTARALRDEATVVRDLRALLGC